MILITGATGTNGRELIGQLMAAGVQGVRAMARDPKRAGDLGRGVEVAAGDFDKPETLGPAIKGIRKLFLLSNPDHLMLAREKAMLEASRQAGVERVVRLSAMGAGDQSPILHVHGEADRQLQESGIAWTTLRPNVFYQNMFWAAEQIKSIGKFFHLAGDCTMSQIDVRDIGAVAARVLVTAGHEGKTYTLTGPESIRYDDIAKTLSRVLGKPVQFVQIAPDVQKRRMLESGMPAPAVDALISLFEYFKTGKASEVHKDFEQVMGRAARRFEDFARDFAAAFKS